MQDFSSFWLRYFESYQRSWQDMVRLWAPNLPANATKEGGWNSLDSLGAFSPDAWSALLSPWLSKDASSNPLASLTEAAQASMKAFAPWSETFSAFGVAAQQPPKATPEDKNLSSAERAVRDAIKRSNTQDA